MISTTSKTDAETGKNWMLINTVASGTKINTSVKVSKSKFTVTAFDMADNNSSQTNT
jgi:hypothetical protein